MIFGAFLAWETRKATILQTQVPMINQFRLIAGEASSSQRFEADRHLHLQRGDAQRPRRNRHLCRS